MRANAESVSNKIGETLCSANKNNDAESNRREVSNHHCTISYSMKSGSAKKGSFPGHFDG
jgi:hypothetical protein